MSIRHAPTYAVAGGPPHDWMDLEVWDIVQEQLVDEVVEVNTAEGWLIRYAKDAQGQPMFEGEGDNRRYKRERVTGKFQLRYRVEKR